MAEQAAPNAPVARPDAESRLDLDRSALLAMGHGRLRALAAEIRTMLVEQVCASGGHLGVNLGVVELSIALHRVFDSPRDPIVFDTGHQSYVHKILTGRAKEFGSLRRRHGLSGYPSRAESVHDWVENSHASTALSYAHGLAAGLGLHDHRAGRSVAAVIGDGAMTGGLAWEGLNNLAERPELPVVIVLNDNGRSYDPTIGGLARHLAGLRAGRRGPGADGPNVFEQLGLAYLGPVDGHDIPATEAALRKAREMRQVVVVHTVTDKGRGWAPAETDPADRMHGIGVLDPVTGRPHAPAGTSWTEVFGREMAELGAEFEDIVCLSGAMRGPVGLAPFAERFPERFFDVGIAEQQAVCTASGMAMAGSRPVVAVYATFLTRALDQVLMDVALHRMPVTFVLDRAGVTGPDGASHHGMWDLGFLAQIPGLRVAAPRDAGQLKALLREAVTGTGPCVIRFPKAAAGPGIARLKGIDGIDVLHHDEAGKRDVLLLACGPLAADAVEAARRLEARGVGVTVADPRWVLPVPEAALDLVRSHGSVVTVEDGCRVGGFGAALALACVDAGLPHRIRVLGLPREFIEHGSRGELLAAHGLDAPGIVRASLDALALARPAERTR
ncbi:1-deoxy-D-xylulose-5-phosphate synthase [Streptomyces paludis]|uniref:1-deoxy-D-xylulose-5-phosphate synthase n=1 Tax=Streptomyces paludis TaxID=2282738 RepID=UPI001E2F86E9|nr:1-deoxy-D-xylulose-5-phosphate synthase [Streptomyces paludis]